MKNAIAIGSLAALVGIIYVTAEMFYYLGKPLEDDLGFRHGSPYLRCGDSIQEVFTIEAIVPGGIFDQAGIRDGDIVMGPSITGFYKLLHRNRGKEVTVHVVDGGDGPSLDDRPQRRIAFVVPANK